MIFSQLVAYFGRAGRQDVDGNLTGLFFFIDASGLPVGRGRSFQAGFSRYPRTLCAQRRTLSVGLRYKQLNTEKDMAHQGHHFGDL